MNNTCRFCAIRDGGNVFGTADRKLAQDHGYFAIPSIGSLVEGWALVVPNEHCVSLRANYNEAGFRTFVGNVAGTVSDVYGPLVAFEHGSNVEGSLTGCGTDHAHLHLVPRSALAISDLDQSHLQFIAVDSADIAKTVGRSEYLAFFPDIVNAPEQAIVALLTAPVSQYFRHLIGKKLGLGADQIDYRRAPRLEVASATVAALQPAFECIGAHG